MNNTIIIYTTPEGVTRVFSDLRADVIAIHDGEGPSLRAEQATVFPLASFDPNEIPENLPELAQASEDGGI